MCVALGELSPGDCTHVSSLCGAHLQVFLKYYFCFHEDFLTFTGGCTHTEGKWVIIFIKRLKVGQGLKKINRDVPM